jgi:GWxTD domain-containing protein
VRIVARGERGALVWTDTASLAARGPLHAGVLHVPVARLGIGVLQLDVVTQPRTPGVADSTRTPLFVSLGDELPVATFEDVLGYLRYYASAERLRALRAATPEQRPAAWAAFLRDADTAGAARPSLRDYFARLRIANQRFDEGQPGWLTDRGLAYVVLGEPDEIVDPAGQDANARGREQVWEYRGSRITLTFEDRNASGRWRLTPASAAAVQAALRRTQVP